MVPIEAAERRQRDAAVLQTVNDPALTAELVRTHAEIEALNQKLDAERLADNAKAISQLQQELARLPPPR